MLASDKVLDEIRKEDCGDTVRPLHTDVYRVAEE